MQLPGADLGHLEANPTHPKGFFSILSASNHANAHYLLYTYLLKVSIHICFALALTTLDHETSKALRVLLYYL